MFAFPGRALAPGLGATIPMYPVDPVVSDNLASPPLVLRPVQRESFAFGIEAPGALKEVPSVSGLSE
jgi:hypothetical protein